MSTRPALAGATDAAQRPLDALAASTRKHVAVRVIGAAPICAIAGVWIGAWPAITLFALIALYELVVVPPLQARFIEPLLKGHLDEAELPGAAMMAAGSALHTIPFAWAWAIGGQEFAFLACLHIVGTLIHAMTFFGASRLLFFSAAAPSIFMAFAILPFTTANPLHAALTMLGMIHLLYFIYSAVQARTRMNERTVRYKTEAARSAEASAAKSRFLATMSHELRTPLNAIIGFAEILEEDIDGGRPPRGSDAGRIAAAGRALLGVINDVLDLSKIEAGKMHIDMAPARVPELARGAVELCAHIAHANGNRVTVDVAADAREIVTDATRLRQCLLNVVSNACKFTNDGEIALRVSRVGEDLHFQVRDTGIGLTGEQAARLFRPFEQADSSTTRRYGGTGLGLTITKRICELLGGDISLHSEPGKGTIVTIVLPIAPAAATPAALAA